MPPIDATNPEALSPTEYELLPPSASSEQKHSLMGQEEQLQKSEGRRGDLITMYIALASVSSLAIVTWVALLAKDPVGVGWFAFHPTLQTLALVSFTYGIMTLQPTLRPKTKTAGLRRHQVAVFFIGFPAIMLGTIAIAYNKWIQSKEHMTTWHGTFGYLSLTWISIQVVLGGGSVWFKGAAFGGGAKAKALWKYHRLSGYILFPTLMCTIYLGGYWSHWGNTAVSSYFIRFAAYILAPLFTVIGVIARVRPTKMNFS